MRDSQPERFRRLAEMAHAEWEQMDVLVGDDPFEFTA
jgi:hypothetical protein